MGPSSGRSLPRRRFRLPPRRRPGQVPSSALLRGTAAGGRLGPLGARGALLGPRRQARLGGSPRALSARRVAEWLEKLGWSSALALRPKALRPRWAGSLGFRSSEQKRGSKRAEVTAGLNPAGWLMSGVRAAFGDTQKSSPSPEWPGFGGLDVGVLAGQLMPQQAGRKASEQSQLCWLALEWVKRCPPPKGLEKLPALILAALLKPSGQGRGWAEGRPGSGRRLHYLKEIQV